MSRFIEVFKIKDGLFVDSELAEERMQLTCKLFFGQPLDFCLRNYTLPLHLQSGLVKLRIEYGAKVESIEALPYSFRTINKIRLVKTNGCDYKFKYKDRHQFEALLMQKGDCDEILIENKGMLTDTSYSNVVFEDTSGFYTPTGYLLNGTKRRKLLAEGKIKERRISVHDINKYTKVYIINAMTDLEDQICVPTDMIVLQ